MIDTFKNYVVRDLNTAYSKLNVLGDENSNALTDGERVFGDLDVPTNVVFKCSYATEWINEIHANSEQQVSSYPFLWINTNGLTQEGTTFTIREMVLATQSDKKWKAEKKREKVINPILLNLRKILIESIKDYFAVDSGYEPRTEVIYSEKEGSKLPEGVDAILFTNIKFRTIC